MENIVGKRIRTLRNELGLTGDEFGEKINVTKVAVSNWENGNRTPDTDTLVKIADLCDASVDWILGRTNERKGILYNYDIDGNDVVFEVSKDVYPNGLTKEEIIEKLKMLKKLEDMGIIFPSKE